MLTPSPEPRIVYRGGDGTILNVKAEVDTDTGTIRNVGPAIGVVEGDAVGTVAAGKMYAIHLGGIWEMPRTGTGAVAFGAAFQWNPTAAGGLGALADSSGTAAVHAYAVKPVLAGDTHVTVMLLEPAARAATA